MNLYMILLSSGMRGWWNGNLQNGVTLEKLAYSLYSRRSRRGLGRHLVHPNILWLGQSSRQTRVVKHHQNSYICHLATEIVVRSAVEKWSRWGEPGNSWGWTKLNSLSLSGQHTWGLEVGGLVGGREAAERAAPWLHLDIYQRQCWQYNIANENITPWLGRALLKDLWERITFLMVSP